jgi:hypothetical protein
MTMVSSNKLIRCPRCQGSTWDPKGGDCHVCGATGVVKENGNLIDYETASDFISRLNDQEQRRKLKNV